jgi:hypothetical protein
MKKPEQQGVRQGFHYTLTRHGKSIFFSEWRPPAKKGLIPARM